jgi:hypothetical protein
LTHIMGALRCSKRRERSLGENEIAVAMEARLKETVT